MTFTPQKFKMVTTGGTLHAAEFSLDDNPIRHVRSVDIHAGMDNINIVRIEFIADLDIDVDCAEVTAGQ